MESESPIKIFKLALACLGLSAVIISCTPTAVSKESYKQTAINECANRPTQTDYNNCVNRAKMEAEEYDIEVNKKLEPQ